MHVLPSLGRPVLAAILVAPLALLLLACTRVPSASGGGVATAQSGVISAGSPSSGQGRQGAGGGQSGGQGGAIGRRATLIPVQATVLPFGTLSADRDTAGVVTPVTQSPIAAPVSGIVARVLRLPGEWVKAGTPVVLLDDSLLKIAFANAQAAVDTATINLTTAVGNASDSLPRLELQLKSAQGAANSSQRTYDSQKALYDLGGISASALDLAGSQLATAQANLETARLALDQARKGIVTTASQGADALAIALATAKNNLELARYNLDNAAIKAPFDGQIASISANLGSYLGQNSAAFVLVSSERQVSFSIAPADAHAMTAGSSLSFDSGGKSVPVRVRQAPSNPTNGIIPITASLPADSRLAFGSIGTVSYLVDLAQGTLVPLNAVATLENRNFVHLVVDGKVSIRYVSVVAESGMVAVVTGLDPGATVIVSPPPGLIQGTQVSAIDTPMPQTTSIRAASAPAAGADQGGAQGRASAGTDQGGGGRTGSQRQRPASATGGTTAPEGRAPAAGGGSP